MDYAVPIARDTVRGTIPVPPSKSMHQRVLVLQHLASAPTRIEVPDGTRAPGEDVVLFAAALERMGRWAGGSLGASRTSLHLEFGMGATGLRFALPLAALRPAGARTLLRGARALLQRPHEALRRAVGRMGGRVKRRHSGALRVLGGGLRGGTIRIDATRSSQYASALLLIAPRIGGIRLEFAGRPASLPYLHLTLHALEAFGVGTRADGLTGEAGRVIVEAAEPSAPHVVLEPDASCAAAWWTAAVLTGGSVLVPGLRRASAQADTAVLPLLERVGARVEDTPEGVRVEGSPDAGNGPMALGEVDLRDSPDLVFLAGALASRSSGETVLRGLAHTRRKESDRVAVLAAGLRRLGASVDVEGEDAVRIRGGALRGASVAVSGDHRAAFAFGVLGLVTPGIVLRGAQAAVKSHPSFLDDLGALAGGAARGNPPTHG